MTPPTADECVCELCNFINSELKQRKYDEDIRVFQYEDKPKTYKGNYIAINALPFVYGFALNDRCILNLNLHIPSKSDGTFYRANIKKWQKFLLDILPTESDYEEDNQLRLNKASYCIANISQPRKDIDNTHYINHQIKVIFAL